MKLGWLGELCGCPDNDCFENVAGIFKVLKGLTGRLRKADP